MFQEFGPVPFSLLIDFGSYEGDWTHVASFRGRSGWLLMANATVQSADDLLNANLVVACDETDNIIPSWRAIHLTQCNWSELEYCHEQPPAILDDLLCEEEGALFARWQRETNAELAAQHELAQRRIDELEARSEFKVRQIGRQIDELRRRRRMTQNVEVRETFTTIIEDLEQESESELERLMGRRHALRRQADIAEEALWRRADFLIDVEITNIVQWQDGPSTPKQPHSRTWHEGCYFSHGGDMDYLPRLDVDEVRVRMDANLRSFRKRPRPVVTRPLVDELAKCSEAPPLVDPAPCQDTQTIFDEVIRQPLSWPEERAEMLRRLWMSGMSAKQIADALGGTSRNAVIAKAKRLGLPFQSSTQGETSD